MTVVVVMLQVGNDAGSLLLEVRVLEMALLDWAHYLRIEGTQSQVVAAYERVRVVI